MVKGLRPLIQYRISIRQITEEIRPLIDAVRDPILEINDPPTWWDAHHRLRTLMANDDIWETLMTVQEGRASNYAIHNLGVERIEWLRDFREKNTKKVKA
jgi:hypothetical protein